MKAAPAASGASAGAGATPAGGRARGRAGAALVAAPRWSIFPRRRRPRARRRGCRPGRSRRRAEAPPAVCGFPARSDACRSARRRRKPPWRHRRRRARAGEGDRDAGVAAEAALPQPRRPFRHLRAELPIGHRIEAGRYHRHRVRTRRRMAQNGYPRVARSSASPFALMALLQATLGQNCDGGKSRAPTGACRSRRGARGRRRGRRAQAAKMRRRRRALRLKWAYRAAIFVPADIRARQKTRGRLSFAVRRKS